MDRSYKGAIEILSRRRRPKRPTTEAASPNADLARMPNVKGKSDLKGTPSIVGMKQWLQLLGHSTAEVNKLNIIHVAGTKGKGSTCAFVESFLRTHGMRTGFPRKTGLYTSPHLIHPEERIRINFQPVQRDLFAQYFFEVFDILSKQEAIDSTPGPRYLQLFALVALHTFIREGVEAAIIETHHGGEYDATNVIEGPVVTVITPLGMDHVSQLGPSIENIAWHKAGILKPGAAAFSAVKEPNAAGVLRTRASEKGVDLKFIDQDPSLPDELNLKPDVQRLNCSLALAVARSFLVRTAPEDNPQLDSADIVKGIKQFSWPGRFQTVINENSQWFLDGAHNEMSVTKAASWFIEASESQRPSPSAPRILIFSQITEQRDSTAVFEKLAESLKDVKIDHVIFTRYAPGQASEDATVQDSDASTTQDQEIYSEIWKKSQPDTGILFRPTVRTALEAATNIGRANDGMQTLITGSQHLVGAALFQLGGVTESGT